MLDTLIGAPENPQMIEDAYAYAYAYAYTFSYTCSKRLGHFIAVVTADAPRRACRCE